MSELCQLITYSMKVVLVVAIVLLMGWGGIGAFQWWQRREDDNFWAMWKKWLIMGAIALVVIFILSAAIPTTVCSPPATQDIPYYGQ